MHNTNSPPLTFPARPTRRHTESTTPGWSLVFYVVNGTGHGFLWREGTFTPVDQGSGSNTLLGDVNESGTVAGNYGPFDSQNAAIYSIRTGAFTSLPPVTNLPINLGNGINSQGDVTGSAAMET